MAGPRDKAKTNILASTAAVFMALELLASGKAPNKKRAAEMAGVSPALLSPMKVAAMQLRNPRLSKITSPSALELQATVTRDGQPRTVTLRDGLLEGAQRCAVVVAELAPRVGDLTKDEERKYQQCARWLTMCKTCGLFGDPEPAPLPGELQQQPMRDVAGSVSNWRKQIVQGKDTGRLITIQREPESSTADPQ